MTRVAIIDYGRGNVRSVKNAVEWCGADAVVTNVAGEIDDASHVILPGVGAFGNAIAAIRAGRLDDVLWDHVQAGKPFLGICLGMQMLADRSDEHGEHQGLGWIGGHVTRLTEDESLKIPHMGWTPTALADHPIFRGFASFAPDFYYCHSYRYYVRSGEPGLVKGFFHARDRMVIAAVAKDNIVGVQFHPEKSQDNGLHVLQNFVHWKP